MIERPLHMAPSISVDVPMRVKINTAWEILFLEKGDVLFVHAHRGHIRMRRPGPIITQFLRELEMKEEVAVTIESIISEYGEMALTPIQELLARLRSERVILPAPDSLPMMQIEENEHIRFRSLLAWLANFSEVDHGLALFKRVRQSKVAIIGAGGAGSLCAVMLAASGIGKLTVIDGDLVEASNLVRQIFFTEQHIRARVPKAEALTQHIRRFSSFTHAEPICQFVETTDDCVNLVAGHDLVILTADAPRILLNREVNRACIKLGIPLIHSFLGQIGPLFVPGVSACFACLEQRWREEVGIEHDEIVEAMQVRPTREYPSMVSGPVQIADALFNEAFGFLSSAYQPRTINAVLKMENKGVKLVPVPRRRGCMECDLDIRKRP